LNTARIAALAPNSAQAVMMALDCGSVPGARISGRWGMTLSNVADEMAYDATPGSSAKAAVGGLSSCGSRSSVACFASRELGSSTDEGA